MNYYEYNQRDVSKDNPTTISYWEFNVNADVRNGEGGRRVALFRSSIRRLNGGERDPPARWRGPGEIHKNPGKPGDTPTER